MNRSTAGEGASTHDAHNSGLLASLKNIATTLLTTGRTRLELLSNEIEEQKLRAVRMLLMAQAMLFCFGVGILLSVALLTLLFWEHKSLVVGACAAFFLIVGLLFCRAFLSATQSPQPVFTASLSELEEDIRQLKAAMRNESSLD
jgi:uncharacterized membrane protein YqjE